MTICENQLNSRKQISLNDQLSASVNAHLKRSERKRQDKENALLKREDFKKDVSETRIDLGISSNGFLKNNCELFPDYKPNKADKKEPMDCETLELLEVDEKKFNEKISYLANKYELNKGEAHRLKFYLLFNEKNFITIDYPTVSFNNINKTLVLKIKPNTTMDDIEAIWQSVEFCQSLMPGFLYRVGKKFDRNKRILQLHANNKTSSEIAEIISNEFGDELSHDYVNKIIARHKKR